MIASPALVRLTMVVALVTLSACSTVPEAQFPSPLREPKPVRVDDSAVDAEAASDRSSDQRFRPGPGTDTAPVRIVDRDEIPVADGKPVSLVLDAVNLTAFIDEVFGNQLGLSLEIEQAVRDKADLVSLRLVKPETPQNLFVIATEVLKRYGVQVVREQGRFRFTVVGPGSTPPPLLVTGRSLPEVPAGQRPVFLVVPLDVRTAGQVASQLNLLFGGESSALRAMALIEANALLLSGPPVIVEAALEAVELFDRPAFRAKRSIRISPLYLSVEALARELKSVLTAQGYAVGEGPANPGAVVLVPVPSVNALVAFTESDEAQAALEAWVETLDQPTDDGGVSDGAYVYDVRNTTAESLMTVAEALLGASSATAPSAAPAAEGAASQGRSEVRSSTGTDGSRLVADEARNAIVFQGPAARWRALRSILARLDRPARQVLVEVTVAEVTLTDEFSHGVEWALRSVGVNGARGPLSLLRGEASSSGVVWSPVSGSGQLRALMNLFASNDRVSILSTPRLLVRSGESASIDVGTEVPIITSQATAPDLGTTPAPSILQQVQYRKTGVLLELKPVVHSSQRVDIEVSQEVSEATPTDTSGISSPSIFSRRLASSLSLSDGESTLIGGLISNSSTRASTEVPGLGRVPLLGDLFASRSRTQNRTELMVLITPYVIEDGAEARAITDALGGRFQVLDVPSGGDPP